MVKLEEENRIGIGCVFFGVFFKMICGGGADFINFFFII